MNVVTMQNLPIIAKVTTTARYSTKEHLAKANINKYIHESRMCTDSDIGVCMVRWVGGGGGGEQVGKESDKRT